jgi:tRNA G10  N-methylase Trm11
VTAKHPAKFGAPILAAARELLAPLARDGVLVDLLDPFAGTGRAHEIADDLGVPSYGVEIEPEWASMHPRTIIGDATELPFATASISAAFTSPCYGNRMSDSQEPHEVCSACSGLGYIRSLTCPKCEGAGRRDYQRNTYRHVLGRVLHPRNAGQLQWGAHYRVLHVAAWRELDRVLRPGGVAVINLKDHYRADARMHVTAWHHAVLTGEISDLFGSVEWELIVEQLVPCRGNRQGENGDKRVTYESVALFRKPAR